MLIAKFSKSVSIADIGCGDAFFTMELAKKFCTGAVAHLAQRFRAVIATYRREHDEKSYWSPMLN